MRWSKFKINIKRNRIFDLIVLSLLGLIPLLWFKGDSVILGHDSGLPFDPITHFINRFYVWSQRLGIGTDQSAGLLGAFMIHGLEALLTWIGFGFQTQQKIQFIFWFLLPGLTMFYFAYKTWPTKKYLPLVASIIYMINYYLLQAWFVAERTKFSIYAALPLIFYFTLQYFNKQNSYKKTILAIGLTLGILNGGGSMPLYGGLIIVFMITLFYLNVLKPGKDMLKKTLLFVVGIGVIYFLFNAYWIISYIYYIFGFFSRDLARAGGTEGALGWATYLSKGSSFINLFRGQGIPDWYLNPYHAYAKYFLNNPLLILASFAYPFLAYLALFVVSDKKDKFYMYLLTLLSLVGLIFASGPQSQLGIIYEALIKYMPGFAIFRSAFFKFIYVLWFAYGILIGFTLDVFFSKLEKKIRWSNAKYLFSRVVIVLFIIAVLLYHYPILDGRFFDYSSEPGKEQSTRITVPKYIFEFSKWVNQQDSSKRFLVVPELSETGYVVYQWGYWSIAPISSLMSKNSFVQDTLLVPGSERFLMKQMYQSFLRQDMESFNDFAQVFAIDYIVLQKDFDWQNISWGTTDPALYEQILETNPNFELVKVFGKWKVYKFANKNRSLRITASSKLNYLQGELNNVMSFPYFNPKGPLFMGDLDQKNAPYFIDEATDIFLAPECIDCELKGIGGGFRYYNPKILPGSFLYPLINYKEQKILEKSNDFKSQVNFYLTTSDRRIVEAKWMVDSKQKLDHVQSTLERYDKSLNKLKNLIQQKEWGIGGKEENILSRNISAHLLQQSSLAESLYDDVLLNIEHRKILADAYEKVLLIDRLARKRFWVTNDTIKKRYVYDLLKTGKYEIFVDSNTLAHPADLRKTASISAVIKFAQDPTTNLQPINKINEWLYYGVRNFKNKVLRLELQDLTVKNLLAGTMPVLPDDPKGINITENFYSFTTDSKNKCLYFPVKNLSTTGDQYFITFKYRNLTDNKDLGFYISQPNEQRPKIVVKESFLPNSRKWREHRHPILVDSGMINIFFCNGFETLKDKYLQIDQDKEKYLLPGQNVIELQDITLHKVSFPHIVLYRRQRNVEDREYVINFDKKSPVEYTVNLIPTKEPVSLNMRESYGKFWRICQDGNCLPYSDKAHFASAGFANAWYFKDGIGNKVNLYYYPQKMYVLGAAITIISLAVTLGGIIWYYLRRR